ncbi:response regulator transcription factor [Paenibacillus sp. N1-5-1-14]|uniref:response regulator transcription factor n=1 Tax=Paenibacillus radicibacter TaxID=2972488 RepID=UPI0021597595|nr:response regulator transcription factor [Paenibacillus radicibacter]MCR8645985.1 response regulator transcription factor [Paenibacillus radicibacter]
MQVLIADDEPYMLKILQAYFEKEGFNVLTAQDGEEALELFYNHPIDLAVLDWMMPRLSGIEACKEMKDQGTAKVLLLTAKTEDDDEFMALQAGADEYIRKPFDTRILIMRVKKLLQMDNKLVAYDLVVDLDGQKIHKNGQDLHATQKEFQLLRQLITNKGQILSRKTLLDRVWGFDYFGDERTVDTHIRRLREKVGEHVIKTHRGMGYSLTDEHE